MQQLLADAISNVTFTTYVIVFVGSVCLSMGSCTWVRIPIVAGYTGAAAASRRVSFYLTVAFVSGCVLSYVCLGILLGMISAMAVHLLRLSTFMYYGLGICLILIGLYLTGIIEIRIPDPTMKKLCGGRHTVAGAFLLGVILALLEAPACPCCGPVLLLLAMKTFPAGKVACGISLFLVYALGQNLPLLLIGGATGMLSSIKQKGMKLEWITNVVGGCILILLGTLFVWLA